MLGELDSSLALSVSYKVLIACMCLFALGFSVDLSLMFGISMEAHMQTFFVYGLFAVLGGPIRVE